MTLIKSFKQMVDRVVELNYIATTNTDVWVICPNCDGEGETSTGTGHPYNNPVKSVCSNCIDGKVKVNIKITRVSPDN
ncbi:hypothetical protein S14_75 [Shewanella sp. phage 1/4]|uniref:hypothetical protein n=1 Tax=Shewanella phage 1/4 TaxID=1458859 RepID=UPI0004F5CD0A|nr:hypothetical protein S14_75 [Shewanella sp. phage 1/4]AHK11187.1 hypothetical protein S14_75 [Shewanella sp. phage 1/4]